jgi:hypothetical protein
MGATTVDLQYERTDNLLANDTSAHLIGVGIDQAIDAVASNVYLHFQHDAFDSTVADWCNDGCPPIEAQSIDSLTAGMIVRF